MLRRSGLGRRAAGLFAWALLCAAPGLAQAPQSGTSLSGTIAVDKGQGQVGNLEGVAVKLVGPAPASSSQSTVTDGDGHYEFTRLAAGTYTLEVSQDGFEPSTTTVTATEGQAAVNDVTLQLHVVSEQIEVREQASQMAVENSQATETVSSQNLETLPLPKQQVLEALPLVPGVVRTSEGKLNFKGQSESQGMLVVDSAEAVDPVSGSFSIAVPIDAVQTMTVFDTPESAQYGGFSGGLTTIETRAPLGNWNDRLLDFIPGFRGKNGHLVGISSWTPRAVFGGPLVKNKVNFSEEVTYEIRKQPVRGLPWPYNETKTESFASFTQLQVIWSARHLLNVNVNVFPLRTQFANINSLVPQTASSNYGQKGVTIGATDGYQFASGSLLSLVARYTRFDSDAYGNGTSDMLVTPEGWQGNFFNKWNRNADQFEAVPSYDIPTKARRGHNDFKFGGDFLYRYYTGSSISHPVDLLAENGTIAEQINFVGSGALRAGDTEVAGFAEDRWTINDHWSLNLGARLSTQSNGREAAFAPHVAAAYAPGGGKTVVRAGAGLSYGHVSLLAADFAENQERVLSFFDSTGAPTGPPIALVNTYVPAGDATKLPRDPGTSPRTFTWNFELEHEFQKNLSLRLSYLDSHTEDLFVVTPLLNPGGTSLLALSSSGTSQYRQAEAIVHYRPHQRADVNVSYVWSRARGDLNTISDMFVRFQEPVIRPDVAGILSSDVPNRVVAWGLVRLFWGITLSPVMDVHTGLPYSNVDVLQNYAGEPNGQRFPTFFSVDARIYKEFLVHVPFTKERFKPRKMRFGIYSLNLTNHVNNHDVYNNIASPLFGKWAGDQRRFDGLVIDLVE